MQLLLYIMQNRKSSDKGIGRLPRKTVIDKGLSITIQMGYANSILGSFPDSISMDKINTLQYIVVLEF